MESGCQTMSEVSTCTDKEQLTEPGIKVANILSLSSIIHPPFYQVQLRTVTPTGIQLETMDLDKLFEN